MRRIAPHLAPQLARTLAVLLALSPVLLAAEECGGGRDDASSFGGGGGGGGTGDGGGEDGGTGEGSDGGGDGGGTGGDGGGEDSGGDGGGTTAGDDTFLSVSVDCEGDNKEYTWTYRAQLAMEAVYVTVEVDPGTSDYEAWYLEPIDQAQTTWQVEVTELLSSHSCDRAASLTWTAFGYGSWEETYASTYSP